MTKYKLDLTWRESHSLRFMFLGCALFAGLFGFQAPGGFDLGVSIFFVLFFMIGFGICIRMFGESWFVIPIIWTKNDETSYLKPLNTKQDTRRAYSSNNDVLLDGYDVIFMNITKENKSFIKKSMEDYPIKEINKNFKDNSHINWCNLLKEKKRFYYELDEAELKKIIRNNDEAEEKKIELNIKLNHECFLE